MKKWGKALKAVMVCVISVNLFFGTAIAAKASEGTESAPAEAAITKRVSMADGIVNGPTENFKFTFTQKAGTGTADITGASQKDLPDAIISYAAATDTYTTDSDSQVLNRLSGNIAGAGSDYPHAGVYVYTVVEDASAAAAGIVYSQAEYEMYVYVANGLVDGDLYIKKVEFLQVKDDQGVELTNDADVPEAKKADDLLFENIYILEAPLEISKIVVGDLGDKTRDFNFTLQTEKAATGEDFPISVAVVRTDIGGTETPGTGTVTAGGTFTFTLKHGERIEIMLPVGTKYTVTETGTANYAVRAVVAVVSVENADTGGTKGYSYAVPENTSGTSLTITDSTAPEDLLVIYEIGVGGEQSVAFTNTHAAISATGILINNLPFILLIIVAVGGFAILLITKRRRQIKSE